VVSNADQASHPQLTPASGITNRIHDDRACYRITDVASGFHQRYLVTIPLHLSCAKARPGPSTVTANCRQIHQWTEELIGRLWCHANGNGARLMNVTREAGIGFILVRTCEGTLHTERAIKNAGGVVRYWPLPGFRSCVAR
jgi:hypothetical protein